MGAKAKKSLKKKLIKASQSAAARRAKEQSSDFLPLEGGQATEIPEKEVEDKATVLYIGHIPHGFYEEQMEGFFKQFGKVKRLRIARNRKTGRSKHYGFLEFDNPAVAKVVANEIHNYLLFEHNLQIHLIPPEKIHPNLWKGVGKVHNPHKWTDIERWRHNKDRTAKQHQNLVQGILKRDAKRRKRIKDAGIEYECPDFVGLVQTENKRIKFTDEEEE
ncbi:MKI67 FHA domain-interacting nucleolar phosphoprotein [Phalaenopsis equestris]|uniref:MKI67 FHA domain-interacting nucleolar phosphoprotein n=1 Tax=Phalaenopsis equestris TaxID=78828 RepID=UPI0009E4A0C8|nr:MKI67 FHA domain-interacting nucleolar phosphoprotein [Phalaenopsis equestris]XP_020573942.1 MKI67 FHA domain-interacting nucleolar phosphoprotein [Phalaenopsis equestris]